MVIRHTSLKTHRLYCSMTPTISSTGPADTLHPEKHRVHFSPNSTETKTSQVPRGEGTHATVFEPPLAAAAKIAGALGLLRRLRWPWRSL